MVQILMQILIVKVSSVCTLGFKLRLQVRRKASMVVCSCSDGTSYGRSIPGGHKPDVAQAMFHIQRFVRLTMLLAIKASWQVLRS